MQYWIKVAGTGDNPFDRGDWATRSNEWVREYGPAAIPQAGTRVPGRPIHSVCGWLPCLLRRGTDLRRRGSADRATAESARALAVAGRSTDPHQRTSARALPHDHRHRRRAAVAATAIPHPPGRGTREASRGAHHERRSSVRSPRCALDRCRRMTTHRMQEAVGSCGGKRPGLRSRFCVHAHQYPLRRTRPGER